MTDAMDISEREFHKFCDFIYSTCGINLHDGKREMVRARVGKQIRLRKLSGFKEYFDLVLNDTTGAELVNLLNVISTNLTYFFRESKHFEYLEKTVIPQINEANPHRVRMWSAGCSTGEEPYTIAMVVSEHINSSIKDWKILATDLSTKVLGTASQGLYVKERLKGVPQNYLNKYFQKRKNGHQQLYELKEDVRSHVRFGRLNLMEPFPVKGPFDVIFCRNVMIYFDRNTQENLARRFHDVLTPGGFFFVGHSESLLGVKHDFKYLGPSVYRKKTA